MTRNEIETATLPALRAYLKTVDAYSGTLADGTRICRAKRDALRAHALTTFDLLAEPEATPEPTPEADVPRCSITGRKLQARQIVANTIANDLLALGEASASAIRKACEVRGVSPSDRAIALSSWCNGDNGKRPAKFNPILVACIREGIACERADSTIKFTRLTDADAAEQRDNYTAAVNGWTATPRPEVSATTIAGRGKQISKQTAAKLSALISGATPGEDGTISLTAEDLALGGLGAAWARISNRTLADAQHVTPRTFASLGYTGHTSKGALILTPLAETMDAAA